MAIITTSATASATENNNDKNGTQTIENTDSKHQRDRHSNEQVSCNIKTSQLLKMANHPSDKQRTIEMLNHHDRKHETN